MPFEFRRDRRHGVRSPGEWGRAVPGPADLPVVLDAAADRLRAAGTDLQTVEVKKAAGGLPRTALESVCAFASDEDVLLILGLTDGDFRPVGVDAPKLASDLASACSDMLEPALRPHINIAGVQGRPVVVARVDAVGHRLRPCFLRSEGMEKGSYLRTHDGDRRLNSYEVHVMVSGRGQPDDDTIPVEGARSQTSTQSWSRLCSTGCARRVALCSPTPATKTCCT